MTTTTYEILGKYRIEDKASGALSGIGRAAGSASSSLSTLKSMALGALGAVVGGRAFGLAKSAFIDFNSSIEQSTISLAAQKQLLVGGGWSAAMTEANGLFTEYQQVAKASVGTTQDFLEMHQGIAASAYRAGMGLKDLKEMTVGATVAAAALGERADQVSFDIKSMLSGQVQQRDRTAQILLASQGIGQDQFNHMTGKLRNAVILKALNDPALKNAARAMGNSFSGVTSTLEDNIKITMGKVGLPLFKAITKEVEKWNAWIEANPQKIAEFAEKFSSALIAGFNAVKSAISWVVENKDLLLKLAEAAMVGKVAGMFGGGPVGLAAAATYAGASWIAGRVDQQQSVELADATDRSSAANALAYQGSRLGGGQGIQQARMAQLMIMNAKDLGVMGKDGHVDAGAVSAKGFAPEYVNAVERAVRIQNEYGSALIKSKEQMDQWGQGFRKDLVPQSNGWEAIAAKNAAEKWLRPYVQTIGSQVSGFFGETFGGFNGFLEKLGLVGGKDSPGGKDAKPLAPKADVHVEVQVVSDDPDRLAIALSDVVSDALRNPSGTRHSPRGGKR